MCKLNILVPELPESVVNATVISWYKKIGDNIKQDEILAEVETDKIILEVLAPQDGILESIIQDKGANVNSQQILGVLRISNKDRKESKKVNLDTSSCSSKRNVIYSECIEHGNNNLGPSVRRAIAKHDIKSDSMRFSDVTKFSSENEIFTNQNTSLDEKRKERRVPMSNLRKCLAKRLLEVTNNTAMLTTFNEVNMKSVLDLRNKYGDSFKERYGVKLGIMSFYTKAVVEALKLFPEINAYIDEDHIVYYNYFDINIAISTPRGLVAPVLRDVDKMNLADIEKRIAELADKGRKSQLNIDDLTGGNFTISNGGVFGSLISSPIINPPQSAILGIHAIKDRPVAINGHVHIMPMMYLALSYDHRLIDGRESINYLKTIKNFIEDPTRFLLNI